MEVSTKYSLILYYLYHNLICLNSKCSTLPIKSLNKLVIISFLTKLILRTLDLMIVVIVYFYTYIIVILLFIYLFCKQREKQCLQKFIRLDIIESRKAHGLFYYYIFIFKFLLCRIYLIRSIFINLQFIFGSNQITL